MGTTSEGCSSDGRRGRALGEEKAEVIVLYTKVLGDSTPFFLPLGRCLGHQIGLWRQKHRCVTTPVGFLLECEGSMDESYLNAKHSNAFYVPYQFDVVN